MKRLFFSSFMLNIAVMLLNIVSGIMMARWLGPYARGEFAAATRWATLFLGLASVGLPGAMIYLGKQFRDRQRELFGAYLSLGAAFGFIGLLFGEALLPLLLSGQPDEVLEYARIAMVCLPFAVLTDGLIGTLQSLNLFRKVMLLRVMSPIGSLSVIGVLAAAGRLDVAGLIWYNTVLWGLLTFALTLVWVFRSLRPRWRRFSASARELVRHGAKIYGGALVSIFGGNFDQLILSLALTPYALGLYAVASSVGGLLPSVLFGALNVFLWPTLMDLQGEHRQRKVERIHAMLFYGTSAVALFGVALLPFALPLLYGRDYAPAVWMGIFMLLISPVRIGCTVLLHYLNTEGKFHAVSLSELSGIGVGFIAMMMLLPVVGEMAAAWGMAAAAFVKWGYLGTVARRLGIRLPALFRPKRVFSRFWQSARRKTARRSIGQEGVGDR